MSMANIAFKSRVFVRGVVTTLTGMHIGGSSTEMSIGGVDKIVIRDPLTNRPYIPGSSLRGKMRSLMERMRDEMTIKMDSGDTFHAIKDLAKPLADGAQIRSAGPSTRPGAKSSQLFGVAIDQQKNVAPEDIIPQRLVVRDAKLLNWEKLERAKNTDMPMTEVKTEVAIDRITSQANPRQIERVPAGAQFEFEFVLNLYGNDQEQDYENMLFECMQLVQDDYLGGHGSRGYGRIMFQVDKLTRKTVEDYQKNNSPQDLELPIPAALKKDQAAS